MLRQEKEKSNCGTHDLQYPFFGFLLLKIFTLFFRWRSTPVRYTVSLEEQSTVLRGEVRYKRE